MNGNPLTRATSPDGRWAYTLYEGTEHPFVHALDTANRSARCIDLDWLHGHRDLWGMRFVVTPDGEELRVRSGERTVAWSTRRPGPLQLRRERSATTRWVYVVLFGALLVAAGVVARRRASSTRLGGATSA